MKKRSAWLCGCSLLALLGSGQLIGSGQNADVVAGLCPDSMWRDKRSGQGLVGSSQQVDVVTGLCPDSTWGSQGGRSERSEQAVPPGQYLSQKRPGEKPERFTPALLAPYPFLGRIAFAPDGKACFFSVSDATFSTSRLFMTQLANGTWTTPEAAPFTTEFEKAREPFCSADGNTVYFNATTKGTTTGMDLWKVERAGNDWSKPVRLPEPLNSAANDFCFSQVADGTIYFLSARSGMPQSYRAQKQPDQAWKAEPIPAPIATAGIPNGDPCVAPDGRFLIFYTGRPGDFGNGDLYAAFTDGKGGWTNPVNLGPDFNTAASEYGATLTPDGKYLFFVRRSMDRGELYWVEAQAIDRLNPGLQAGHVNPKTPPLPSPAAYLGQPPPGDTPVVFAPKIISAKGEFVGNASFTPDGREFYYTVTNGQWDAFELRFTQFKDGKWAIPAKPTFVEKPLSFEPAITHDGQRIYFSSGTWTDLDIWYCNRVGDAWGKPNRLAEAISASGMKMFPSIARTGTLFFGMQDEAGGRTYCATSKGETWNKATPFNADFNTPKMIGDPLISPNEDYLIFLTERPEGFGQADLYISFRKPSGAWTPPKNLGPKINTDEFECGPSLTPDGKFFLFTRRKQWKTDVPSKIFWVKADFIEQFRHLALDVP